LTTEKKRTPGAGDPGVELGKNLTKARSAGCGAPDRRTKKEFAMDSGGRREKIADPQ